MAQCSQLGAQSSVLSAEISEPSAQDSEGPGLGAEDVEGLILRSSVLWQRLWGSGAPPTPASSLGFAVMYAANPAPSLPQRRH